MRRNAGSAIAVHLVDLPLMLADAIRTALADDSFRLLDGPPSQRDDNARTVVIMARGREPEPWLAQLRTRPDASILLVEPHACEAELIELYAARRQLGALDIARIAAAVRSARRWQDRATPCAAGGA